MDCRPIVFWAPPRSVMRTQRTPGAEIIPTTLISPDPRLAGRTPMATKGGPTLLSASPDPHSRYLLRWYSSGPDLHIVATSTHGPDSSGTRLTRLSLGLTFTAHAKSDPRLASSFIHGGPAAAWL